MPIVTAHGVVAVSHYGVDASQRLEQAMRDAVLQCNAEGIDNSEENAPVIRRRMKAAHQRVLLEITKEEYKKQVDQATATFGQQMSSLIQTHNDHLRQMAEAHEREVAEIATDQEKA